MLNKEDCIMTHWVDRAEQQLEEELENGRISDKEFREQCEMFTRSINRKDRTQPSKPMLM